MKKNTRQIQIYDILLESGRIQIKELANQLHVTTETIRSDLNEMESQSLVIKEHGWVRLNQASDEKPVSFRIHQNKQAKRQICIKAFECIKDGDVIFLDAGSTLLSGVDYLQTKKDITVVTHSILVASHCCDLNIHTILTGGELSKVNKATSGYFSNIMLDRFHFDKAFIGSLGFKDINGFTTCSLNMIDMIRHVINQTDELIVVCDSSKMEVDSPYISCSFKEVDTFVTDSLTQDQRTILKDIKNIITL